jgi:GNAT superfamily N-acetyltransferase
MNAQATASTRAGLTSQIVVRPYTDADEAAALEVLAASLGGGPAGRRTSEFFRWKHQLNPFGRSFILVAEAEERVVGVRALMRWRFATDGLVVRAVRAVDTATHPDWQGRGLFTRLTLEAVDRLRSDTDLIFNTPNTKSLTGYLKMGWRNMGKVPVAVKVRRPLRFVLHVRSLNSSVPPRTSRPPLEDLSASEAFDRPGIKELLNAQTKGRRLATPLDLPYLRWRYASAPLLDYRAVVEGDGDHASGLAIFRVRSRGALWESTVCELFSREGDSATCRRLLRRVASAARVDHITCHFPLRSVHASSVRRLGFLPSPGGVTFVVNPLRETPMLDPQDPGSWSLSLGDLELF